jgi:hypothetical protein
MVMKKINKSQLRGKGSPDMSTSTQANGGNLAGHIVLTSREAWMWIVVLLILGAIAYVMGKTIWQLFVASIRGNGGGRPSVRPGPPPGYEQGYSQNPPAPPQGYGQANGPVRMRGGNRGQSQQSQYY